MSENLREILQKYSEWLEKNGYLDTDWWREEPKAIDRYLKENKSHMKRLKIQGGTSNESKA